MDHVLRGVEAYFRGLAPPKQIKSALKYIIAGEVRKILHTDTDTRLGPVLSNREDVSVVSTTLLILDCDSPVALTLSASTRRAGPGLLYCSDMEQHSAEPRWRCFIPILPLVVDNSDRGRMHARLRYAWFAGLWPSWLSCLSSVRPVAARAREGLSKLQGERNIQLRP